MDIKRQCEIEAFRLAKAEVKADIRAKGNKVSSVPAIEINIAARYLLEHKGQRLQRQAEINVAAYNAKRKEG